jgi:hypothetical protein
MPGTHKRNTDGLVGNAQRRREETARKVDEAIERLSANKERVNFNSVSTESGVSKAYLYTHTDIRDRIDDLRKQQEELQSPKQLKREMTDASKDVVIAAKNKRIKDLEDENKMLKQELQILRSKLYDVTTHGN